MEILRLREKLPAVAPFQSRLLCGLARQGEINVKGECVCVRNGWICRDVHVSLSIFLKCPLVYGDKSDFVEFKEW